MFFSLIVPTVNRKVEVDKLFQTLAEQIFTNFEVILVDQNSEPLLDLVDKYKSRLKINHLKAPSRGLNKARNLGAKFAHGDVITFPDDDCYYHPYVLEQVEKKFKENPSLAVICTKIEDEVTKRSHSRFSNVSTRIKIGNAVITGVEASTFTKKNVYNKLNGYDETLGLGAGTPWGSGEGFDFILRILSGGYAAHFFNDIVIYHPAPFQDKSKLIDQKLLDKLYGYSRGFGHVLRKNSIPFYLVFYYISRPFGGLLISLFKLDWIGLKKYKISLKGLIEGWFAKN